MSTGSVTDIFHIFYKRYDIIKCICDDQLDKRTVEARLDVSRPTVDRAYRELEDIGILTSTGTSYELTSFGVLCCAEFHRVEATLRTLAETKDLLSYLPKDTAIDMRLLRGADIHYAQDHAPQEPLMEVVDVAVDASEINGYSSTITPHYVDAFHALIVEDGTPATLVFTEDVVETGYTNYTEKFGDIVAADHTTVYATELVYTYGAAIGDEAVAVPVGDELDRLQAVIVNDSDDARACASDFLGELITAEQTRNVTAR